MKLLVTGGYFDDGGDGVVWLVDLASETAETLLRWEPPDDLRVPTKGFAGADLDGDTLFVAAHAAVVRIDVPTARVTGVLHQPCMNDLHHVRVDGERLYVANTGGCAVDVFARDGRFLGSHAVVPSWVGAARLAGTDPEFAEALTPRWDGRSAPLVGRTVVDDYHRRGAGPFHQHKVPDHLHVNHVAMVDGRPVATCFADGSLRDLSTFEVLHQEHGTYPHDGVVDGDSLWLTHIDGTVVELDRRTWTARRRLDAGASGHAGWCRGVAVTKHHLVVGLTEVRRLPPHRWADRAPEGTETSVLLLDRQTGRLDARVDLTDVARHSKLYSVLPLEER